MRLYLEYQDGSVRLPLGETIIGRGVECSLRFNDPYVSRRHARIELTEGGAWVEEISSRNGTLLNGAQVEGRQPLEAGDTLELGRRSLSIVLLVDEAEDEPQETTQPNVRELAAEMLGAEDAAMRELYQSPRTLPAPASERTCPQCRARVPATHDRCAACGHEFLVGRPASTTQRIELMDVEAEIGKLDRRTAARLSLAVPVVYNSETMTIDALTYDLSRSGVFIASPLLDEVGTPCQVTLLPEAAPAIPIDSVVARIVSEGEAGMGVRFEHPSERARQWLEALLDRRSIPAGQRSRR
jgi:pSer/pThr/pTyr-binding forkhead associated (FHA) protein